MLPTIELIAADAFDTPADAVIVGVYEDQGMTPAAAEFDRLSGGAIRRALDCGDASSQLAAVSRLTGIEGLACSRLIVVGLGRFTQFDGAAFIKAVLQVALSLKSGPIHHAVSFLEGAKITDRDPSWALEQQVIGFTKQIYRYLASKTPVPDSGGLTKLSIATASGDARRGLAIAEGITLARELGNLPPNVCTPAYLAETALRLAAELPQVSTEILEQEDMEKLGMGALLAVARGSANPPKLIVIHYRGAAGNPQVLVGKGVTFDTGGISIKPWTAMDEMKFDMCGGAAVLATVQAVARIGLPLHVIGIIPAVENMPDGKAYRPGDVLNTMSGHTIEILNTDAEGRLILCDALHYAKRFAPERVVDVATLTGACAQALGKHAHGLMTNDEALAEELLAAGQRMHDRAWRLPLWRDYQGLLASNVADVANVGGKLAGAITAACFLERFINQCRWAHLDIAGTAWEEGRKGGATGRPVALLVDWLCACAQAEASSHGSSE